MESRQSVHDRITYRRVASVIDAKIDALHHAKSKYPFTPESIEKLQYAVLVLRGVRDELEMCDATHYWPSPL